MILAYSQEAHVIPTLADGVSLEALVGPEIVFQSGGKWLYPLFELEEAILDRDLPTERLVLHDRIAGRAAAALMCRLGIRRCHVDIVSGHALETFRRYGVECTYGEVVGKIQCRTEDIIQAGMELGEIHRLLKKRAKLAQGIDLEIAGVEGGYPGKPVLKGVDLHLVAGDRLVLTGENGAGKTTLLKAIIGAVPLTKGWISADGTKPGRIGYVAQSSNTAAFPLTTEEVVGMGLLGERLGFKDLRHQIEVAMRRTGCISLYGRNYHSLSGGERQRVSLARCLCQNAGLILLDEPTSFLDTESRSGLIDVLNRIVNHRMPTVLLVSHDHEWIDRLGWPVRNMVGGTVCSS